MKKNDSFDYTKALKQEKKGDKLFAKGKYREALQAYQESEQNFSEREEIYQKLIETLNKIENDWSEEDFSASVTWTMRQQELKNPKIKRVHEQFSLEFQEVQKLAQQLMIASDKNMEENLIDKILDYQEKATLPLIHFLLTFKELALQSLLEDSQNKPLPSEAQSEAHKEDK